MTKELRENELKATAGGISKEQFNQLPIGARIKIVTGRHAGKEAVILSYKNDWMSNVRIAAWIRTEDGSEESITSSEFEVIG